MNFSVNKCVKYCTSLKYAVFIINSVFKINKYSDKIKQKLFSKILPLFKLQKIRLIMWDIIIHIN